MPYTVVGKGGKVANKKQRRRSNNTDATSSSQAADTHGPAAAAMINGDRPEQQANPAAPLQNAVQTNTTKAAAPRKKPFAFVLLGLNDEQRKRCLEIHSVLGVENTLIKRTNLMKSGNLIVEPSDDVARATLQATSLPEGLNLKPLNGKSRSPAVSHFVVLKGVHESIEAATIERALGLPCKRLLSSANGGKATLKIKLEVKDEARRKEILEQGVNVGSQHFRAAPIGDSSSDILRCHKCYEPGHIAKVCKKEERLCRRCGGGSTSLQAAQQQNPAASTAKKSTRRPTPPAPRQSR